MLYFKVMKFSGHRLDILRRAVGSKATHNLDFESDSKKGLYKETVILNKNWVVKMFKPQPFDYLRELGYIPGSIEWAKKVKEKVEEHTSYVSELVGEIYDKPRIFIGKAKTNRERIVNVVYKAQRNRVAEIKKYELDYYPNKIDNGSPKWEDIVEKPENIKLKLDFKRLYTSWKHMRQSGLSFDLYPNGNMTIVADQSTGELRLKVFDAIPLFLFDENKFKKYTQEIPRDLIVLRQNEWGTGYNDSEEFFKELEKHFVQE